MNRIFDFTILVKKEDEGAIQDNVLQCQVQFHKEKQLMN